MLRRTCRTLLAVVLLGVLWLSVPAWAAPAPGRETDGRQPWSVPASIQAPIDPIEILRSLWAALSPPPSQLSANAETEKPVTIDEGAGLDPHGGPKK